jgi:hypothetical protein
MRLITALLVTMLAFQIPAEAGTTPVLSGKYLDTGHYFCQPGVYVTYGTVQGAQVVTGVSVNNNGTIHAHAWTVNFDNTKGTATVNGPENYGSALLYSDSLGNSAGNPFATRSDSYNGSYSNTSSTLTVNGTTYQAVYGQIKNGVAQSLAIVGIDSYGCSDDAYLQRQ